MFLTKMASLTTVATLAVVAQNAPQIPAPIDVSTYAYAGAASAVPAPRSWQTLKGVVNVAVQLQDPPLAVVVGPKTSQNGTRMTADEQRAYLAQLKLKQDAILAQAQSLGGVEIGRVNKALNAVMISVDAGQIEALQSMGGVASVRLLGERRPMLDAATSAYIGARAVQATGITGRGVRVAMLDTGIDYTHRNLGGSGDVADYQAATAAKSGIPPAKSFPNAKVIGGYDFAGDCPTSPCRLSPDPNPIDTNGHGTATADTVAGVAPDALLYALKVFYGTGGAPDLAILKAIDFALDPTNSGTLNNPVDIMNMSFGSDWGVREEALTPAITNAVNFGVVCVISAGNAGNVPYILGSPGTIPEAITVGATTAVDALGIPLVINAPPNIAGTYTNTALIDFAPVKGPITADVAYVGRGCPAGSITDGSPDDPYTSDPSGKIALIDRGACAISLKIDRAANSGAVAVLIGLVAPGDAISFGLSGGTNFVPSLVITQTTSNSIKKALNSSRVNATISPANAISLASNVADYSSRGPNLSYNMLKPDLSAPGSVNVAQMGTGNGQTGWNGTSFSSPLTAGAAALLLSKDRTLTPLDVKAILIGTSEPGVFNNAATQPGYLAPLSRMGAGELRADRMVAATTSVWDASNPLAVSLSFGTYRLNTSQTFRKKVVVRNYSSTDRTYVISNGYRNSPNATGVTISAPPNIFVPANSAANFNVALTVTPTSLPNWTLNGGSNGANGDLLNTVEYAGYLTFAAGSELVRVPWHILPHRAANVAVSSNSLALAGSPGSLTLTNVDGALPGRVNVFSLVGTGVQFPPSALPGPGSNVAVINLRYAGVRLACLANCASNSPTWAVQFAVTTFGERSHPDYPAEFDVYIDVDNDGSPDLIVFNGDIGAVTTGTDSGQNGIFVYDVAADAANGPYSYTSADLNSANAILTVPLSALQTAAGLNVTLNSPINMRYRAFDNYFTGRLTDQIGPVRYELDMPKFYALTDSLAIPPNAAVPVTILPNSAATPYFDAPYNGNSPSQLGLLFMYTDAKTGQEASIARVTP